MRGRVDCGQDASRLGGDLERDQDDERSGGKTGLGNLREVYCVTGRIRASGGRPAGAPGIQRKFSRAKDAKKQQESKTRKRWSRLTKRAASGKRLSWCCRLRFPGTRLVDGLNRPGQSSLALVF